MSKIWTQKPPLGAQLDPSHPLSQGLVGCWLMNEGGGNVVLNLVNNSGNLTKGFGGTPPGPAWIQNGLYFNGIDGWLRSSNLNWSGQNAITIVYSILIKTSEVKNAYLLTDTFSTPTTSDCVEIQNWSDNNLYWNYGNETSGQGRLSTGITSYYDKKTQFALVSSGAKQTFQGIYANGKLIASQNSSRSPTARKTITIGGWDYSPMSQTASKNYLYYFYIYNRSLSPQEIMSLYVAPYQMIYRPTHRIYSIISGGATNASISQVAQSLTLSTGTQAVATTRIAEVAQTAQTLSLSTGTQAIATVRIAEVTQVAANLTLTPGTQVVTTGEIVSVDIAQEAASLTLTTGTQALEAKQVVNISQESVSLVLTQGLQVVETIEIVDIAQVNGTLVLTTGTQIITTALGRTGYKFDSANHWISFTVDGVEVGRLKNNGDLDLKGVVNENAF